MEIGKPDGPILRMKANGSPILAELWELDQALLGDFTEADLETRTANVGGDTAFVQCLVTAAIASERVWPKSKYVEFQIYEGFIQVCDEDACRRFHAAAWKDRPALIDRFHDPRLKKLARRLIYFERPDLLYPEIRGQIDRAIWGRLREIEPDAPGRSYAATLQEFDALVAEIQIVSPSLASYCDHLQAQLVAAA